ncbi:hypothetical protein DZA65_03214 [Dickeya dianthicola]|uniref:helix-turn-helix transcriptional regulator n=1 Tax=Dickeya dianthicola TaxID=204039 RepID=UPI000CD3CCB3|nr:helix-turn-helix transcriptional regulator [Dickeya dianthicola]AYC20089.1 hypothetical protein DZA65_03214 [Dickeya dianthicola]MBI0438406.1 helix-turn-helix domain-containing protein [Dickeya dianthicola]MBI0450917.1 helix-turn-helix domain-containing protein [Dickeya dianthicola]MBI0454321.1 helix-turn-helix domain-containing protein [Dickeya dianthicola]MBI0458538.1 helix-turn-helix domain-containing protein [Dickeya dianthicola]
MKSIYDIRRENLQEVLRAAFDGKQSRLAERLEIQPNLVSRWENGKKNIGTASARKIELAGRLPQAWMDTDHVLSRAAGETKNQGEPTSIGMIAAANLSRWMAEHRRLNSQQRVADASGVSQATINRMLNNEASITLNNMAAIAEAFGRRPYEMIIAHDDDSIIQYDHTQYAALPGIEKDKIHSFIEFILQQNR